MKNYFKKFGIGWLIGGVGVALIYGAISISLGGDVWLGFILFLPFLCGFFGFIRFFAWIASWEALVVLNGLYDLYMIGAGSGGAEYLGPAMILTFPLFLLVGIFDEVRYKFKVKRSLKNI